MIGMFLNLIILQIISKRDTNIITWDSLVVSKDDAVIVFNNVMIISKCDTYSGSSEALVTSSRSENFWKKACFHVRCRPEIRIAENRLPILIAYCTHTSYIIAKRKASQGITSSPEKCFSTCFTGLLSPRQSVTCQLSERSTKICRPSPTGSMLELRNASKTSLTFLKKTNS